MAISMLKIRRPLGRLIFSMGIAIPGKTVFLIETAPCRFPVIHLEKFGYFLESPFHINPDFNNSDWTVDTEYRMVISATNIPLLDYA